MTRLFAISKLSSNHRLLVDRRFSMTRRHSRLTVPFHMIRFTGTLAIGESERPPSRTLAPCEEAIRLRDKWKDEKRNQYEEITTLLARGGIVPSRRVGVTGQITPDTARMNITRFIAIDPESRKERNKKRDVPPRNKSDISCVRTVYNWLRASTSRDKLRARR